jgi:division protein CdvB (Snf7/Vps24/ESCRT-III family)
MVAKYDLRIMEARAKIQKIQSQIDELEKKRDNFISQRKERNDLL